MIPSLLPTLVPGSRATVIPAGSLSFTPYASLGSFAPFVASFAPSLAPSVTEPPTTQRSATAHPRLDADHGETRHIVAVMRMNLDFLASLDHGGSPLARGAVQDIQHNLERLERRFAVAARRRASRD